MKAVNFDVKFDGGNPATSEQVFPCRCGETHRGDYAQETFNHHNCFHGYLWPMDDHDIPVQQMMCSLCGEVFDVELNVRL